MALLQTEKAANHCTRCSEMYSRMRFRYRLVYLIIFVGVISVACWYWWHCPFEVEVVIANRDASVPPSYLAAWPSGDPFVIGGEADPFDQASVVSYFRREVRTVRRYGFKGTVRHGRTLVFNKSGRRVLEEHWSNGARHGVFKLWGDNELLLLDGRFERGVKHGRWSEWNSEGTKVREEEFVHGDVVSLAWFCAEDHCKCTSHRAHYDRGSLVSIDGKSVTELTLRLQNAPIWIQRLLDERYYPEYDNWSSAQVISRLEQAELSELSVRTNEDIWDEPLVLERPFDSHLACAPLRVGIVLFLRESELICDYRFGEVWVTTRRDAANWSDKTGMDELRLQRGTRLTEALNRRTAVELATQADVRNCLGELVRFDCPMEAVNETQTSSATIHTVEMPIRYWLHQFLGRNDLECELVGNQLLITAQM